MIIEEIQNHAYRTSGKLKGAQKRTAATERRENAAGARKLERLLSYASDGRSKSSKRESKRSALTPGKEIRTTQGQTAASHPPVPRGLRSFGGTIGYAAQEQKQFKDLPEEIRAEHILSQNLHLSPDLAGDEMKAVASQCTTGVQDACRHFVISWDVAEIPDREEMRDAVRTYLQEAGYEEHQAIAYCHRNTDNIHVHLVVNAVNPNTLKGVDQKYVRSKANYKIREKVARQMEAKYDRTHVKGKHHTHDAEGNVIPVRKNKTLDHSDLPSPELEKRPGRREQAFERNSGLPSFKRYWAKSDEAHALRQDLAQLADRHAPPTWKEVHALFAAHNLELKPVEKNGQKFGFVIHDKTDPTLTLKASEFDVEKAIFKAGKIEKKISEPFTPSPQMFNRPVEGKGYGSHLKAVQQKGLYPAFAKKKDEYHAKLKALEKKFGPQLAEVREQQRVVANVLVDLDKLLPSSKDGIENPAPEVRQYKNQAGAFADLPDVTEKRRELVQTRLARERTKLMTMKSGLVNYTVARQELMDEYVEYRGSYRKYLTTIEAGRGELTEAAHQEIARLDKKVLTKGKELKPEIPGRGTEGRKRNKKISVPEPSLPGSSEQLMRQKGKTQNKQ